MRSKTALKTREKGTGTVYKSRNRFYLKTRINGKTKTLMLRNPDGSPCTTRKDADKAADGMRRVLLAETLEETAHYVQEAKRLKRQSALLIDDAWETYLTEPQNKSINPALRIPQKKRKQTFFLLFRNVSLEKRGALQY